MNNSQNQPPLFDSPNKSHLQSLTQNMQPPNANAFPNQYATRMQTHQLVKDRENVFDLLHEYYGTATCFVISGYSKSFMYLSGILGIILTCFFPKNYMIISIFTCLSCVLFYLLYKAFRYLGRSLGRRD